LIGWKLNRWQERDRRRWLAAAVYDKRGALVRRRRQRHVLHDAFRDSWPVADGRGVHDDALGEGRERGGVDGAGAGLASHVTAARPGAVLALALLHHANCTATGHRNRNSFRP
jgi:hypothetical protein